VNNNNNKDIKTFFLNVPFISDKINRLVKKLLKPLGIKINLSQKSKHLKDIVRNKIVSDHKQCRMRGCIVNSGKCERTHVVYQMVCKVCASVYIGSTKRKLHQRIKEHITQKSSLVYQHQNKCNGSNWNVEILYTTYYIQKLRFMESMLIKRFKPNINVKENIFDQHIVF
jgi:hypothetical protein